MRDSKTNPPRAGKASVLGIVLVVFLLLLAITTLSVNLIFKDAATVPELFGHRYYVYQYDDMETADEGSTIPKGAMVILDDKDLLPPAVNQIVLYRSTTGDCRIGQVSLVLNATAEENTAKQTVYYLTTAKNASAIAVTEDDIIGICRQRSTELGAAVGFLTGTAGLVLGMILPCVAVLLYIAALFVAAREEADDDDDDDTDLMFVKALQEKKKALEQQAAENKDQSADDDSRTTVEQEAAETEAAIRRAEKFAAIRKNIEGRRTNASTSEIPLYTTASRPAVSVTKQMPAPDPELMDLIAGRSTKQAESAKTSAIEDSTDALIAQLTADKTQQEIAAEPQPAIAEPPKAEPAAVTESKPAAPKAAPKAEAPKAKPAVKKAAPAKKPAAKPASSGTDFSDLMAMLDAAKKNLEE